VSDIKLFVVGIEGIQDQLVPPSVTRIEDIFETLPIGVYTSLCTFEHNKFLLLEDHLDRLQKSMAYLGWEYRLDQQRLRRALHEVCTSSVWTNSRVRIDVLAHSADQLHSESRLLIALTPFPPIPARLYENGVVVGIGRGLTRSDPHVKKATFVTQRRRYLDQNPSLYECLLVAEDGTILEGSTSNFFAVKAGRVWTAGEGVLEGIARKIVFEVAQKSGIPINRTGVRLDEIGSLTEAALSSSSRAIIPIVEIDGRQVGDGRPGPVIKRLLAAYRVFVADQIRTAI